MKMVKVSIGLPVYNGENFIVEAIDSLLDQTFEDFEIIICDNASTDGTGAICQAAAKRDARIHYYRNSKNLGAAPNFNRCLKLAKGDYFKWAAHDDICRPEYLERCVEVLDNSPDVVACHSRIQCIDPEGNICDNYDMEDGIFDNSDPIKRFVNAISERHWCFTVFSLIRRSALLKSSGIGSYIGSDRNLIAQIALQGRIVHFPEVLFLPREHSERSIRALLDLRDRGKWYDTAHPDSGQRYFSRLFREHMRILFWFPLTPVQRLRGIVWLSGWAGKRLPQITREILS